MRQTMASKNFKSVQKPFHTTFQPEMQRQEVSCGDPAITGVTKESMKTDLKFKTDF